ncbi:MAG: pyruvate:ferredoxin (flavodoxin) oxidoreductase [Clostridia bacterium]|nr:pyruvate:ferredoxin (flavodoxin) oxidoreductase [Clostridia bacterium]
MKKITVDGNTACASMSYLFSDLAFIYPITPSSPMAENVDAWSNAGKLNFWNRPVKVTEMQSEAGASGALHGALTTGANATTFTSSQGLLLMIPNMFKIAGEQLPCVINVAARTIATHALSIFGDHSDIYACRSTGFSFVASSSVQEAQDMALASHILTLSSRVPVLHFFDGFRTSHEINTISEIDPQTAKKIADECGVLGERPIGLTPLLPSMRGTSQSEDIYFQNREASSIYYKNLPDCFDKILKVIAKHTGRHYSAFEYYGAKDATNIVVCMGSGADTVIDTALELSSRGAKVGAIKVRLYRPFDDNRFLKVIPKTATTITVLDRTKECGALYDPLASDVISAIAGSGFSIRVLGGRYGLSSKEFTPSMVVSVFENAQKQKPKNHFVVGIVDDVNSSHLPEAKAKLDNRSDITSCMFFGYGSDGTVSANKNSIKIIANSANMFGQAYFVYDSKKSGSLTTSHLRISKKPINMPYLIEKPDFVACHNKSYLSKYDMLSSIRDGGIFLLNAPWKTLAEFERYIPANVRSTIAKKHLKFYCIDAEKIAESVGLNRRINLVMQTAFFALGGFLPIEKSIEYIKEMAKKTYASKGEKVLAMNYAAVDQALGNLFEVTYPEKWAHELSAETIATKNRYYDLYLKPILERKGNALPVSHFEPSGTIPTATSKLEKRNIATKLPLWKPENCIECNFCSIVCPHAVIRPYIFKSDSKLAEKLPSKPAIGVPGYNFKVQISPMDCTSCENCALVCPAKEKALVMVDAEQILSTEQKYYKLLENHVNDKTIFNKFTIKGSQFEKPLFEFSGACAGCGETPYIKLLTQLFGEKLLIANATGCSSIYSGTAPTCPYTTLANGAGPAWANSLFEDNAEFGLGMKKAYDSNRALVSDLINLAVSDKVFAPNTAKLLVEWQNGNKSVERANKIVDALSQIEGTDTRAKLAGSICNLQGGLVDTSVWIVGGDGWAYDIGYGGLDHVLASGENVNILVLDTELYSNTGGQASKATPMASTAKFAAGGKTTQKKDLGALARIYPNVYVAQVSLAANMQATISAFKEAGQHNGPSIIIAYCPCINHGADMSKTPLQEKQAVESGYWPIYRYDPQTEKLTVDSDEPKENFKDFALSQSRYFVLAKTGTEKAKQLLDCSEAFAKKRLAKLFKLSQTN